MENGFTETLYPLDFRKEDAKQLGEHLRHRHSVELIGIRRVGISNFLRFFLYHRDIVKTYIKSYENHLFIPIDLNDLIEREIFAFWRLTFKRIVDAVEQSPLETKVKKTISTVFVDSIQSDDLFLTVDGIRQSLMALVKNNVLPTLFLIRFDRLKDAVTPAFFDNLQGLKDATAQKLVYVFTSFRPLNELAPSVFEKKSLSVFSHRMYVKPANEKGAVVIFQTFQKKYQLRMDQETQKEIVRLSGGHVQYLQLSLIVLNEQAKTTNLNKKQLAKVIPADERIVLQSEELWESLTSEEQTMLKKISKKEKISQQALDAVPYLLETGCVVKLGQTMRIFSPLFEDCVRNKEKKKNEPNKNGLDFTKKEQALFDVLKEVINQICERETIVAKVWPEYSEIGISDWAVDRLVARLRAKLKKQNSPFRIVTVKTRGYKLIVSSSTSS